MKEVITELTQEKYNESIYTRRKITLVTFLTSIVLFIVLPIKVSGLIILGLYFIKYISFKTYKSIIYFKLKKLYKKLLLKEEPLDKNEK